MTRYSKQALLAAVSFLFLGTAIHSADAASNEEALKAQQIVAEAQDTVLTVKGSPQGDAFRDALADASGVLVVPDFYKGGLILGGATGEAYYGQPVTTREILQGSASPRYDAGQLQQSL